MDIRCETCNKKEHRTMFRPECGHHICLSCFFQKQNIKCIKCNKKYDFSMLFLLRMFNSHG